VVFGVICELALGFPLMKATDLFLNLGLRIILEEEFHALDNVSLTKEAFASKKIFDICYQVEVSVLRI
jgi:hypothetical protein